MIQGRDCRIAGDLKILGKGKIILGNNVTIGNNVIINVSERLKIDDRSIIGSNFIIDGRDIEIGTEFWSGHHCQIGGGSCFEKTSILKIGYWCHLGNFGYINTARPVHVGNEVGMGTDTKIYTHGAYLSFLDGFPVEFGPVTIGKHV
jgi:acetyltransferase-like isoleucine patch superfamily enzyme